MRTRLEEVDVTKSTAAACSVDRLVFLLVEVSTLIHIQQGILLPQLVV